MGQLLNRLSRYLKSEIVSNPGTEPGNSSKQNSIDDSDVELKRIIDELKKKQTTSKETGNNDSAKNKEYGKKKDKIINLDEAYDILGLKSNVTIDEIKSAYKQKVKEYHPDRVANLGIELKQLAEQKTQEINKAYEIIKNSRGL